MAAYAPASPPIRDRDPARQARRATGRALIYAALLFWAFISLFPIYWTVTTSFKVAVDVTQGHIIPWLQYEPDWKGWRVARAFSRHDRRVFDDP